MDTICAASASAENIRRFFGFYGRTRGQEGLITRIILGTKVVGGGGGGRTRTARSLVKSGSADGRGGRSADRGREKWIPCGEIQASRGRQRERESGTDGRTDGGTALHALYPRRRRGRPTERPRATQLPYLSPPPEGRKEGRERGGR